MANDTDADGHVQISIVPNTILNPTGGFTQPSNGTVTLIGSGDTAKLVYVPNANYNGSDSFSYTITDGQAGSINSTTTVSLTVLSLNDNPVAIGEDYVVDEDSLATNPANTFDVLSNDTDLDTNTNLTITNLTQPLASQGTVTIVPSTGPGVNPKLVFVPAPNYNNTPTTRVTFTYTANDGKIDSNVVTVSVLVTPSNDLPTASNDTATVVEDSDGSAIENQIKVLSNDTDADGNNTLSIDPASILVPANLPSHGTITIIGTGNGAYIKYVPNANYNNTATAPDSFKYSAVDGAGGSSTATVTILVTPVNDLPVATDDTATVTEDSDGTLPANQIKVLINDTDADGNTTLSIDPASILLPANLPLHGTITIVGTGNGAYIKYVPNANYNGSDSFKYSAVDGAGGSSTATVNVTVTPNNDAPVASPDEYVVDEDSISSNPANSFDVLVNDTDVDVPTQVLSITNLSTIPASQGTVTIVPSTGPGINPKVVFVPSLNYNNTPTTCVTFTYTANDGTADSNVVTVSVLVTPVNDLPVGVSDNYLVQQDSVATNPANSFDVLINDTDIDGDSLSIQSFTQPVNGTVIKFPGAAVGGGVGSRDKFLYVPNPGYYNAPTSATTSTNPDTFTYIATDTIGNSNSVTVSVVVTQVVVPVVIPPGGGTIIIKTISSTPAVVVPFAPKQAKPMNIKINDPYLCNDDIYGSIDTEDNSKAVITVTLTNNDTSGNNNSNTKPLVFTPSIDKDGNYRIKIDHDNQNSPYYVPDGEYVVRYSVTLPYLSGYENPSQNNPDLRTKLNVNTNTKELINKGGQYLEGKSYKAYIIHPDKCNPIIIPFTPIQLTRTGGNVLAQFTILIMIIIGLIYIGERKEIRRK